MSPDTPRRSSFARRSGLPSPGPHDEAGTGAPVGEDDDLLAASVIEGARPRLGPARLVGLVLAVLLAVILLGWALPALTGASWVGIVSVLASIPVGWTLVLAALAVTVLLVDASGVTAAVPGLRYGTAVRTVAVTTAVRDGVPGGGTIALALLLAMLRRAGIPVRPAAVGALLASLADVAVGCLLPAVGVGAYLLSGTGLISRGTVAILAAVAVLQVALVSAGILLARGPALGRLADGVADGVGALPVGPDAAQARGVAGIVVEGRDAAAELLRLRGARILMPPVLVRALQAGIVAVALRAVGLDLPAVTAVLVFAISRVLAMIPLTPSGTGFSEPGTGAVLVALGADAADAAAAAVLISLATLALPLALGAGAALLGPALPGRRVPAGARAQSSAAAPSGDSSGSSQSGSS